VSRSGSLRRKGVCLSRCCHFPQLCIIRSLACFKPWSCIKTPARLEVVLSNRLGPPAFRHLFLEDWRRNRGSCIL
jgi:hypothetical protein